MHKSVLWAEDLEGHRQPSLYYLNEDDDGLVDGPHLICDWNGPPTDFDEIDLDTLGLLKQHDINSEHLHQSDSHSRKAEDEQLLHSGEKFIDYPNPTAELVKPRSNDEGQVLTQTQRHNDFDLAECAHLDFLSVPPITQGLLRHIVKTIRNVKIQQELIKKSHDKDEKIIKT